MILRSIAARVIGTGIGHKTRLCVVYHALFSLRMCQAIFNHQATPDPLITDGPRDRLREINNRICAVKFQATYAQDVLIDRQQARGREVVETGHDIVETLRCSAELVFAAGQLFLRDTRPAH